MKRLSFPIPIFALILAAACASGTSSARSGSPPAPGTTPGRAAPSPETLHLAPATVRYFVRQDVHIQQDFAGLPPTIDLGYGLYITATVTGPADSSGYLASFTVDSISIDSGSQIPPQLNLAGAKGYRVTGRLTPTGEFTDPISSDSGTAASLGNLLPRFRSFFPRLPANGVHPDTTWNDSATTTDGAGGASITTRSHTRRSAVAWEDRAGTRALRIEISSAYDFNGSGEQGGAPFTISGSGVGAGMQYLAGDGRYLGGEARDSTTLTIDLPMQGISIPRRQIARTTTTALPK